MRSIRPFAAALLMLLVTEALAADEKVPSRMHWYRCNTHTHTGAPGPEVNATAQAAVEWYRAHGYQCLFITDHEFLTDVAPLNRKYGKTGAFLVLPGQEISQAVSDPGGPLGVRFFHVNGLGIDQVIWPVGHPRAASGITPAEIYRRNIDAIHAAGGIAQVNHPNLQWSVRPEDLLPITKPLLMEIWNAFPTSNNLGGVDNAGKASLSTEELWDTLLSSGKVIWGTATDDTHDYLNFDKRETTPTPGKAWIMIKAPALTAPELMRAMREGRFYASTGIKLESYSVDTQGISMKIAQVPDWNPSLEGSARFSTRFLGANGRLLAEVKGDSPRYTFKGDEQYVRASIMDSDGRRGWTQPVFLDGRIEPARFTAPSTAHIMVRRSRSITAALHIFPRSWCRSPSLQAPRRAYRPFPSDPATLNFTRPLYPYPLKARYRGRGDPNDAASFIPVR